MTQPVNIPAPPGLYDPKWLQLVQAAINTLGSVKANDVFTPTNGFTHQIPVATGTVLMTPAGALSSGTLTLPPQAMEGFEQNIVATNTVGALTIAASPGQTISGSAILALAAYTKVTYRYVAATSTWYKVL